MATVNKDFKVKYGLVVEGSTGTINGENILTESEDSQDFILDLIGGETLVKSVSNEFDVSAGGELSIDRATVDAYYDAAGSADDAETAANSYTDGRETAITTAYQSYSDTAEADAVTSANSYTDGRETAITTAYQSYADTAESDAVTSANSYTDGRETAITTAYEAYADQAEVDAKAYTDTRETAITTAYEAYADQAEVDAKAYTDTEIAALVDSAPATLDTLNELAAALQDNPDIISDLQDIAAGKQDTLTAGSNIDITGDTISVTGLDTADVAEDASRLYFTDTRAVNAVIGLTDSSYYPLNEKNGKAGVFKPDVASGLASESVNGSGITTTGSTGNALAVDRTTVDTWYDAAGSAATAETNANSYTDDEINALTTSDIEEGTNQYYTKARAEADAGALIANATKSNIEITYTGGVLSISAENGVADSDTDDLDEGTTNLYFTDVRAVDALEAVVPNFTAVELNSVAKQIAATVSAPTGGSEITAYMFDKTAYRSAKFIVKTAYGSHTELSEVLITLDTSDNIAITEYAIVGTNGSSSTITADIAQANVRLRVTPTNNDSTITVMGTLLV